jgi:hypothetical protein
VTVAVAAIVAGGVGAALILRDGDGAQAETSSAASPIAVTAAKSWKSSTVRIEAEPSRVVSRRVVVALPVEAERLQLRVRTATAQPAAVLITGRGDEARTRRLSSGRVNARLPREESQRQAVVVLRAGKGEAAVTFTLRYRVR